MNLGEMDKFLDTPNLLRANPGEVENPNVPITSKEAESVIKPPPSKERLRTGRLIW